MTTRMSAISEVTHSLFMIGAQDLRRELYTNFEMQEVMLNGTPIYLCKCRSCRRTFFFDRVEEIQDATKFLEAIEHVKTHGPKK